MTADIIHHGHINIIANARKYGEVIVGLLTDTAIAAYKRVPFLKYEERKKIVENLKGVSKVVPQYTIDYTANLEMIKPDYVINGDDWREGPQRPIRDKVIEKLKEWGGRLIEVPYTKGVSGVDLDEAIRSIGTTPDIRRKRLRELIRLKPIVRVIEASNGLTGLIAENTKINKNGELRQFDAMWIGSLCDSALKGKPDIGLVDFSSRLNTIHEIMEVTTKPIILDGDTGGFIEHFAYAVKTLERLGVSAIIIEDKIGLKKNSILGRGAGQIQDNPLSFARKIREGRKALVTHDFMIIARIESLILGRGIEDAVKRAKIYIAAGADGIMIHSREKNCKELKKFCSEYNKIKGRVPLIVVPTTYNSVTEDELLKLGVNIVIYANQLLRSSYPAMVKTAEAILKNKRSMEAEKYLMPIEDIINLIPGGR